MNTTTKHLKEFIKDAIAMIFIVTLVLIGASAAVHAEESDTSTTSIYCDDGSLCVPEGEPEPECD